MEVAAAVGGIRAAFLRRRAAFVALWWRRYGPFVTLLERTCGDEGRITPNGASAPGAGPCSPWSRNRGAA